jgi:hypothetical protein
VTTSVVTDWWVLTAVSCVVCRGVVLEIRITILEESALSLFGIEDCRTVKTEAADSTEMLVAMYSASQPTEVLFEYPVSDHHFMPIIPTFV